MKLAQLTDELGYKAIIEADREARVRAAYTSDLLSDVMGNAPEDSILITIQAHKNTVAVASLVGMKAIVICNGRSAPEDMQNAAHKEGIAIYGTTEDQFTVSCRIGALLRE